MERHQRLTSARFVWLLVASGLAFSIAAGAETGEAPPRVGHWLAETPAGAGLGPVDAAALQVTPRDAFEWLHYGGNYASHRHSPIATLTPETVKKLKLAWVFQTGVPGQLEANPIVYDGVLYLTSPRNRLFALDAASGALLWRYDHPLPGDLRLCCGPPNRGVAIGGDAVLMATLDARLVALHRRTGALLWNVEIVPYADGYSATSAPLIVHDLAVIGVGGGEYGARGFFDAFALDSGERRWRHYAVPGEGEPGSETWSGNSNLTGGGSSWATGSYDAETDTLFVAVGNPSPEFNGDLREGDNLYSDSMLAIDPKTGSRKWHFQFTPHDVWDYDGNSELWLVDVTLDGAPVKAVAQANRNGYFYLIDRTTGAFLRATQYVEQLNWATIDKNGRPVVTPGMVPAEAGETPARICPGITGGNNASYAGAVSTTLGLAFVPTIENCSHLEKAVPTFVKGVPFFGGSFTFPDAEQGLAYGHLSAIDLDTGAIAWRHHEKTLMLAGVLSTAGGVLFTGNSDGHALALDAKSGEVLWRFPTSSVIRSQPVAYQAGGKTYVAIGSGGGHIVALVGAQSSLPHGSALFVFELE